MVDITGLDKASVIQALYAASRPQGMGFIAYQEGELPREQAESLVGHYIDYLHGRVMKLEIDGDSFDKCGFDRDNGHGTAARVIEALRAGSHEQVAQAIHKQGVQDAAEVALADMRPGDTLDIEHGPDYAEATLHMPDDPQVRESIERAKKAVV